MAASEETCDGNPNFAIICSFITKFGNDCGVNVSIPYLQQMLEDTKNVPQDLLEIILHLMRRGKKRVNKERWEKCVIKFCHEYSSVDAWEIERFGFLKSKLSVKLELLKRLLELQFDANAKFKAEVNKLDVTSLRLLPIGRDIDGHAYWYQLDKECNMRLYKETCDEEGSWQLLCSTTEDLKSLIASLEKQYSSPDSETCEDKTNDSSDPKSPPPDMPVPKIERDTEGMTSCLSESKPCTIIIKTEKRENHSLSETPVKSESCAIVSDKKPEAAELVNNTKGSVKLKLKLETSSNSSSEQKTVIECSVVTEKSAIGASDTEPVDMDIDKPKEDTILPVKSVLNSDVEMKDDEDATHNTNSVKLNDEHSDQNSSKSSKLPVDTENSINHHKSSKIKLYEKWNNEKKKLDISQTSTEDSNVTLENTVENKEPCDLVTKNQNVDPAIPVESCLKQSTNEKSSALDHQNDSDLNETAVDLSTSSRVNVIVQNTCSKPVCTNEIPSSLKSNAENNACINNFESSNSKAVTNSESSVSSPEKALDLKYRSHDKESEKFYKRNKVYTECYDASIVTNSKSNSGISHLQALQNMCESNSMGGIPSVIQSTNHHKTESNKTVHSETISATTNNMNFEETSRKYNFNDTHNSDNKINADDHDSTTVLLKSNVHASKDEKKDNQEVQNNTISNKLSSDFKVPVNEVELCNKLEDLPTDLSCQTVIKSSDNEQSSDFNDNDVKSSSSVIIEKDCDVLKAIAETDKGNLKSIGEKCSLPEEENVDVSKQPSNNINECSSSEKEDINSSSSVKGDDAANSSSSVKGEDATNSSSSVKGDDAANSSSSVKGEDATNSSSSLKGDDAANSSSSVKGEDATNSSSSVKGEDATNSSGSVKGDDAANSSSSVKGEDATNSSSSVKGEDATNSSGSVKGEDATNSSSSVKGEDAANSSSSVKGEDATNSSSSVKGEDATNSSSSVKGEDSANSSSSVKGGDATKDKNQKESCFEESTENCSKSACESNENSNSETTGTCNLSDSKSIPNEKCSNSASVEKSVLKCKSIKELDEKIIHAKETMNDVPEMHNSSIESSKLSSLEKGSNAASLKPVCKESENMLLADSKDSKKYSNSVPGELKNEIVSEVKKCVNLSDSKESEPEPPDLTESSNDFVLNDCKQTSPSESIFTTDLKESKKSDSVSDESKKEMLDEVDESAKSDKSKESDPEPPDLKESASFNDSLPNECKAISSFNKSEISDSPPSLISDLKISEKDDTQEQSTSKSTSDDDKDKSPVNNYSDETEKQKSSIKDEEIKILESTEISDVDKKISEEESIVEPKIHIEEKLASNDKTVSIVKKSGGKKKRKSSVKKLNNSKDKPLIENISVNKGNSESTTCEIQVSESQLKDLKSTETKESLEQECTEISDNDFSKDKNSEYVESIKKPAESNAENNDDETGNTDNKVKSLENKNDCDSDEKCNDKIRDSVKTDCKDTAENIAEQVHEECVENSDKISQIENTTLNKENNLEHRKNKVNEILNEEKDTSTSEDPITLKSDDTKFENSCKKSSKQNDTKMKNDLKNKAAKTKMSQRIPARRSTRRTKSSYEEIDLDMDSETLESSKDSVAVTVKEESTKSRSKKEISKDERVTKSAKSALNSKSSYDILFKIYNLRHSICLESKFKHPLCDKYVKSDHVPECIDLINEKSPSSKAHSKAKKSPIKKPQPIAKAATPAKKPPPVISKKGRKTKKEVQKDDFTIPEGFLEILDKASDKGSTAKKRKGVELKEALESQNSSDNESNTRKRSRRIQEQHQKKMTELAVEMEKEQRMLEQMAKRSNSTKKSKPIPPKTPEKPNLKGPATKNNTKSNATPAKGNNTPAKGNNTPAKGNNTPAKGSNTPTKSPKAKAKFVAPVIEEETCMDSKRTTRRMNSRSKNLTKMTFLYEDESKDSNISTSRDTEKSKKRKRRRGRRKGFKPWDLSSESSSSIEIFTEEEEEEEPDEPLIFDVNEDEFACEEVDPNAEPVVIRRARTAKKVEIQDEAEECINDDTPCQKCGKYDKPEWILLCDKCDNGYHTHCLIPPLMIVPDGDWFCQPCEHLALCQCLHEELNKLEVVLKQKEREALRKQRLAYVGISLDNVLKPEKKEKSDESSKEEKEEKEEEEGEEKLKERECRRAARNKSFVDDEQNEKLYGKRSVRARRNVNYQFKEYDELIFSALQEDMLEVPEEFKELGSDVGSDKPFKAKIPQKKRKSKKWDDFDSSEDDSGDDYQGESSDSEATAPPSSRSDQESGSGEEWKITKSSGGRKKSSQRKPRKSRRQKKRGYSSEEDWEDEVVDKEAYRPTTRRAAQSVSYREISSEEEDEWGANKRQMSNKRRKASSSESESSFKKKSSKKKRIRRWGSSESSEESEEKSMSSSGESEEEEEEEESGEQSGNEFKIDKKETILKSHARKKVLSSDEGDEEEEERESSNQESAPKKKTKKVVSEESDDDDDEEEEEEEEDDDDDEEEEEEEESESEEESEDEGSQKKTPSTEEKAAAVEKKIQPVEKTVSVIVSKEDVEKKEKLQTEHKIISMDKQESLRITENSEFQPKVLVKKELCSVDIPLEPIKQTITATPLSNQTHSKTVRKEAKMVPCVIPYSKSSKSGRASTPDDDDGSDNDAPREEEMPSPVPGKRPPVHIPKQGAVYAPPPSSRIQYGGVLPRHTVPPISAPVRASVSSGNLQSRMLAPTNLSVRPLSVPSNVVVKHPSSRMPLRSPTPVSRMPAPPSAPSTTAPSTQTVQTKSETKPYKSTIMEPFSNMDDDNDSDDEVPLERIPTTCVPAPSNRPVSYEREAEYRPAAKELPNYSYAPPEEKPFPGSYSNLSNFQDFSTRPSPLKPSLVETYPNNSSPSKLTPLDNYSQTSSPKGFISLDSYSENRKKKHSYGNTSQEGESSHRPPPPPSENFQGGEIRFPPEPYPCPQSPNTYPHRSPPPNQRDPGTPPRLYSQFPDAYAPPRSPEYYQNHQYYASEERIPRPSYQPNYAPQEPSFVSNPYVATPVPQPNGGFMIDTLLRARNENEEDELTGVTDIVSYITQE